MYNVRSLNKFNHKIHKKIIKNPHMQNKQSKKLSIKKC